MLISDWSSDVCSSDLHICDDRSGFSLAHRQPVFGAGASDTSLDPVKAGDPPQRLLGYRGIATFGVVKEATPDVRPAEGERSRTALPVRRLDMLIGAIAVALDAAREVPAQLFSPDFPATRQLRVRPEKRRVGQECVSTCK